MVSLNTSPILSALTRYVRIISTAQAGELLDTRDKKITKAWLRRLETEGLIERVGGALLPKQTFLVPLLHWRASQVTPEPNFDSIAYKLKQRRFQISSLDSIWRATPRGFAAMELPRTKRPARRSNWEHDLGLTQTWICLRHEIETENACWTLEDDFNQESMEASCKPDAFIEAADGQLEYIEYGGCYSADTLRKKFESWYHLDWRLF